MKKQICSPASLLIVLIAVLLLLSACSKKAEGSTILSQETKESASVSSPKQSRDFTQEEVKELVFFLSRKRDRIPGMFLICSYEKAEDLDLSMVFFNGTSSSGIADLNETVDAEELAAAVQALGFDNLGLKPQKRPRAKVISILKKYTALSEEAILTLIENSPPAGIYLEEYDAYYSFNGDSEPMLPQVTKAHWLEKEHLAQIDWEDTIRGWHGTAVMERNADGWRFISNQLLP